MARYRSWLAAGAAIGVFALVSSLSPVDAVVPAFTSPPAGAPFQYQLQTVAGQFPASGGIDVPLCVRPVLGGRCVRAAVFDIDLYEANGVTANAPAVRAIRAAGGYAICYVDAGTWESWRPDASAFPPSLLGRPNGWPGERWLDVRHLKVLLKIMARRVRLCQGAGFQAVEFDNVDGYLNATGFAITAPQQISYNEALATLAHHDHLAAGLKNDASQAAVLQPWFNFAIEEQCVQYQFCASLRPFFSRHKSVYDVEYVGRPSVFCRSAPRAVDVVGKGLALFSRPWRPCR